MLQAYTKKYSVSANKVMALLRLIIRAVDLHSRFLKKSIGLTIPQLLILQEINAYKNITPTQVSLRVKLSNATVSGILERLRTHGYIMYKRNDVDKRKISLGLTPAGKKILIGNPLPVQQQFIREFEALSDARKETMLNALEFFAHSMFQSSSAATDANKETQIS